LTAMLAVGRPDRRVLGVDPDERKIQWAKEALRALPNVELRAATVEALFPEWTGKADAVTVCDVLYLFPPERRVPFLAEVKKLLRPGGRLLLKDAEAGAGWKSLKGELQEQMMVKVLRRTKGSGAVAFAPREVFYADLKSAGFSVLETVPLAKGFSTPHVLFVAERAR
jgi:SAM-dependent methyltransferase